MAYVLSLYSTLNTFLNVNDIRALCPKAKLTTEDRDGRWSKIVAEWSTYTVTLNYRGLEDPTMSENLSGFAGFVWQSGGQTMDHHTYRLIQKIKNIKHSLGIIVEPDMDDEEDATQLLYGIAVHQRALLFIGAVTDWEFRQLSGPPEERDAEADFGEAPDAAPRRERSNIALKKMGVGISKGLPPLLGEDEIRLRSAEEILERAGAIFVCAGRAEPDGLTIEEALDAAKRIGVEHALTPEERAFIAMPELDQPARLKFSWRCECMAVLLWSLNQLPELSFPKQICDVPALSELVHKLCSKRPALKLRSVAEILDAADFTYRLHWATVDHRANGGKVPTGGANEEIVMERHYAFNWLIGLRNEAWDDVETDT